MKISFLVRVTFAIAVSAAAMCPQLSAAAGSNAVVLAQAGATGGTIGKRGKSVSGGTLPVAPQHTAPARTPRIEQTTRSKASGCGRVTGTWSWFINGEVHIKPAGTFSQPRANLTGQWFCRNGEVIMVWSHGFTDRLRLSADGKRLSGTNNIGFPVGGTRR